jgi:hypothetical protein
MKIFDDVERTDVSSAAAGESSFAYLNRSGRPEMARLRDVWEEWFGCRSDPDAGVGGNSVGSAWLMAA